MQFQKGYIYHIYNQGNNRRRIFFEDRNYLFFVEKIRTYILPHADIMAWCLMPNHFHLMVYVNEVEIEVNKTNSDKIQDFTQSKTFNTSQKRTRTLNDSIGILLRSYTRAINKEKDMSGSLFRKETKAICVNCNDRESVNYFNTQYGTQINIKSPEKQYPQVCFDYIHQNPVKAALVTKAENWQFSSAKDYSGLRDGTLVNKEVALQFVD